MNDYILVMKGDHQSWSAMSADDKQRLMEKYYSFVNRLKREGLFKSGSALKNGGVEIRSEKGFVIVDGPFSEAKEAINGYFVFQAENFDKAVAIARDCPALVHGEKVEVFELTSH